MMYNIDIDNLSENIKQRGIRMVNVDELVEGITIETQLPK